MSWEAIILTFALIDNVILSRLLGVHPDGTPASLKSASAAGVLLTILMTIAAVAGSVLDSRVLIPLGFVALRTPVFVLVVWGCAQLVWTVARRLAPMALDVAGISMSRAAVSTVALGVVLLSSRGDGDPVHALAAGIAAGAGFFIVTSLLAAIRLRLEIERVPRALRGFPLQLITAGLMAYAFLAFDRGFLARFLGQ